METTIGDHLTAVEKKSIEDAVKDTIQSRVRDAASTFPATFWFSRELAEWEVAPWWSPQRDQDLRRFVKEPGNDVLVGAVSSMIKKFRAMAWKLDGPASTVDRMQALLSEAEFGKGWGSLISKVIEDYLCQDRGAFIEIIGGGDPNEPLDGLPSGLAHLDSEACQLTGDPNYPVVYWSGNGQAHRIHMTRVIHLVDMESPSHAMRGIGFCAVSRVVAASQLLMMVSRYKREKLDDLPQAGLLLFSNVIPEKWADAKAEYERERRQLGQQVWRNIMTLFGMDPAQPATADFISFSQIPDHFDEQETISTYINIVALAFGVDAREFWPVSSGSLGTAAESLVMHQKAKGKGIGELISTLERAINWHVLPSRVTFEFDFTDDEEDLQRAQIESLKTSTILKMYAPDASGVMAVSREELRDMLARHVSYFEEAFLENPEPVAEADDTDQGTGPEGDEIVDDTDQKRYNPSQPRAPEGTSIGGRWVSAEALVAQSIRSEAERREPEITRDVAAAVAEGGGEMVGLEYRLKEAGSMARKLNQYAKESGTTVEAVRGEMKDAVRYTAVYPPDRYVAGARTVQSALERRGWTKHDHQWKNYWVPGDDYDGYNCVFESKDGFLMELQFHTTESIGVKHRSHKLYERARVLPEGSERDTLLDQMASLWADVPRPPGWDALPGVERFNG